MEVTRAGVGDDDKDKGCSRGRIHTILLCDNRCTESLKFLHIQGIYPEHLATETPTAKLNRLSDTRYSFLKLSQSIM